MALEMRAVCERCGTALSQDGDAVICSFECTFCASCGETGISAYAGYCPECGVHLPDVFEAIP